MTTLTEEEIGANGNFTFICNECRNEVRQCDSEVAALNAATQHDEYGPGHFDYTITDPDGEVIYGDESDI